VKQVKISHHFDDATLVAYSSGTLTKGMALLVESHIGMCEQCMEQIQTSNRIGGDLLQSIRPVAMESGCLDRFLAMLDGVEMDEAAPLEASRESEVPESLAAVIGDDLDALEWKSMGLGVQQYDLKLGGVGATRLLRIQPGVSVPHHTHTGNELTLILRGSYSDEIGRFQVGDVADLDDQLEHQPIVDTDQECICLIATDAPLKFSGLMGKLVQPFIGL
jgi:putative transcriptional regulator